MQVFFNDLSVFLALYYTRYRCGYQYFQRFTQHFVCCEHTLSNNLSENSIRPLVIGRKNFLFSDTQDGANASMMAYSIIETAKANGLDPLKYIQYMQRKFILNLILLLFLNLLIKPFYVFFIDMNVQRVVGLSEYGIKNEFPLHVLFITNLQK